jgi:aspartyl protease family protein
MGERSGRAIRLCALSWALVAGAQAQSVTFNGVLGDRALLVIDGQAQTLAVGASAQGVKLLQVETNQAQVQVGGRTQTLHIGGSLAGGNANDASSGSRIILPAGLGGHFTGIATINGHAVQFIVDTGATNISIGRDVADRIGLDYSGGGFAQSSTANGVVVVRTVTLSAVRVGDVLLSNVTATVMPQSMPYVLLGNSFLSRFQMRRDNDSLVLDKKF